MRIERMKRQLCALIAVVWMACVGSTVAGNGGVTFNRDIAPIFQKHCQDCHRPGEVAPMSLLTYEESRPWVKAIKKSVTDRSMPPWHADPAHGKFLDDISLSEEQIAMIVQWADQGAPEGEAADLPPPVDWKSGDWKVGTPDLVIFPDRPFDVRLTEEGKDIYQCIVLPTNLTEDVWVQAFEYKIENRRITHHIVAFSDATGKAAALDAETPEPGFPCGMGGEGSMGGFSSLDSMLGGWGPGVPPNVMPEGTAKQLKKGSHIVLQMHYYNQTGEVQQDASGVGVYFAKGPVQSRARVMAILTPPRTFKIAAGDARAENRAQWIVAKDAVVYSTAPHMHRLGREMTLTANYPDGTSEILIHVPRYDFNWQRTYRFAEPKTLPKGTKVQMISYHDNSVNWRDPSAPSEAVAWGESTSEEMSIGFVGYWYADEKLDEQK